MEENRRAKERNRKEMEKQGREMSGYGEGNCSEKPGRRLAERGSAWARGSIDSSRKARERQ